MAFILKSTKFIHYLLECSRQRAVISTRKNVFFSMIPRSSVIKQVTARTVVSLAAAEQNNNLDLEHTIFKINLDIKNKRIFLKSVKEVFDVLKQSGKITDSHLMLLLKCCSEASFMNSSKERIQFAEEIWKTAADLGMELNINHYNGLLSVFLENNHEFSPSEFLKELEKKGLEPNMVTNRRILKAFCQKGDIMGASGVLEKMKELNFPLSEEDFNALIQCHCEVGDFQKANEILKIMQEREIEPTEKTYLNLLCGYAKHGEIKKMMDLLENLSARETYLSCSNFLEIIYTLAVNDQEDHIDKVLQKMTDDYEKIASAKLIIQRLLHRKMDSIALQLFEKIEGRGKREEYVLNNSKYIIKHFALYREPKETLNICLKLEEKGWARYAVNFALEQIFHNRDEKFCLNFLRIMIQKNMPVRSHYFWPLLIRASEKGNSELLHILSVMPQVTLANSQYTTSKVVFPNYKFSDNWEADNEVLQKAGLPQKWLSLCFIKKLLEEQKMEEVERLVSLFPVDIELSSTLFETIINYVQAHPQEVERFVNILYYLAHDLKLKYNHNSEEAEESFPESSSKNIFDIAVKVFVRVLEDKTVFEQVLQKMLERKFGISTEGVSAILQSPNLSDLEDLAKKLSDPGLQFVYDDNLLKLKTLHSPFKQYKEGDKINIEKLQEELERDGSFFKTLHVVRNMIRIKRYEDAIKLIKVFDKSKEPLSDTSKQKLYFLIIKELYSQDQYDWAEKAFDVGVDMGIINLSDYIFCLSHLFRRGESSLAVEKYCDYIEKTKNTSKCVKFLTMVASKGTEDDLRRVMSPLVNLFGKNILMTNLFLAFTESGNFSKAKKLLETKKFKLMEQNFYYHCHLKAKQRSFNNLESFLKLVKDTESLDRVPLYKLLIQKYAKEENIEKVKQLWLLIEEDDISDFSFLEKMRELMDEPSVARLKDIASTFLESEETKKKEVKSVTS